MTRDKIRDKDRGKDFERKAVVLNFISLIACIVMAFTAPMLVFLIIALIFAIIEAVHFIFGDITTSYRFASRPFFRWFGLITIFIFIGFIVMAFFGLEEFTIFFSALLIAWITDQAANCIRLKKKNNDIKGTIGCCLSRKLKKEKK